MELAGRHALVTGGGSGIGAAIARALTQAGASVTLAGRDTGRLSAAVEAGIGARSLPLDVTDGERAASAVAVLVGGAGPVDILINNAGAAESAPFARLGRDVWDRMIAVNLTAVFEMTRIVLPGMVERGRGRVVTVASTAGLVGYRYVAAYVAAKHGAVGLTRALALEVARSGVTVNAVCPGYTETALLAESVARVAGKTGRPENEVRAEFARGNPQGRLVMPDEVAATVLFLCGKEAGAITGQAIAVAGGEVM